MALERKDVRFKVEPDAHEALTKTCAALNVDIGEYVEGLVIADLRRRVHEATVLAPLAPLLGINGKSRES